jgi:hypothetical protein
MYGIMMVGLMWITHVAFLVLLAALIWEQADYYLIDKWAGGHRLRLSNLIPCLAIFGLVHLRYLRFKKYEDLDKIWGDEPSRQRKKRVWGITAYIVLNILITLFLGMVRAHCR